MAIGLPSEPDWKALIKSGCRLFVGGNASVPYALIQHLIDNSDGFSDIELVHMLALGDTRWVNDEYKNLFKANTFFIGGQAMRQAVDEGRADYTPVFLSEISSLFSDGTLSLDAALVNVSRHLLIAWPNVLGSTFPCWLMMALPCNLVLVKFQVPPLNTCAITKI